MAIARALVAEPAIVWADEPTGNLDTQTAAAVIDLLLEVHAAGQTVVLVTHDRAIGVHGDRVLQVRDGLITVDGPPSRRARRRPRPVLASLGASRLALMRSGLFAVIVRLAGRNTLRRKGEALLVVLGSLLGTAIITSSFVVGDTLHATIRDLARTRLGPIDEVVLVHDLALLDPALQRITSRPLPGYGRDASGGDRQRRRHDAEKEPEGASRRADRVRAGARLRCRPRVRR